MPICRTEPRRFTGRTSRSMNRSRLPFQSPILPNPPAGLWGSSAARLSSRGPQRAPGAPPWPYRASPGIGMGEHRSVKTGNSPLYTKTKRFASSGGHGEPSGALVKIGADGMSALLITAIQRLYIVLHSQRHAATPPTPVSWPRSIGRSPPGRSRQEPFPSNLSSRSDVPG